MEHEQTISEQRKEAETGPEADTRDPVPDPAAAAVAESPEAASDAASDIASAASDIASDTASAASDAPSAAVPRRRRGRTVLLIAGAAVFGVLAGTVTGYAVQYHREPTPLPPLAQQKLDTPKPLAADGETTFKSINANRWHKTDDDLTKLLLEPPSGAKVLAPPSFESLDFFAAPFENPEAALRDFATGVRRVALTSWVTNDRYYVDVRLIQFADLEGADDYQKQQAAYMPKAKYAGNPGVAVPGVPDDLGHVWVDSKVQEKAGYEPLRSARAVVRRGDVVLEIFYHDNRGAKIAESDVIDLAKRQLERL
uniref:Tat pathway signal sequence domain protein n=1 Tax=Streptomyces sp. NBC_00049 TaxID=2903617 RepID=A0AAU2JSX4_9ACTN